MQDYNSYQVNEENTRGQRQSKRRPPADYRERQDRERVNQERRRQRRTKESNRW